MAMMVRYNASANRALSHADKNDKARSKAQAKLASGMKINSAGDDSSSFSIGARMRVKLRALEQDTQNVQNGSAILNTAEGGIQRQIDLLRTIRAKVIDAANDSNTDEDRQTIQKELYHLYTQMENIAYETDYNSKKPLLADMRITFDDEIAARINATKLNLIRDAEYETLDNITGPFATFDEYSATTEILGTTSGYVASTSSTVSTVDFSSYNDINQLNNVGIQIGGSTYVFTNDTTKNYGANKIDISDCTSISDAINKLKNMFSGVEDIDETTLKFSRAVYGVSSSGGTQYITQYGTGKLSGVSGTTGGGFYNPANDGDYGPPSSYSTLTVDLSDVKSDSGFKFEGVNFHVIDSGDTARNGVVNLTKGSTASGSAGNYFRYNFDGRNLTFTATSYGTAGNNYYNGRNITDGYTYTYTDPNKKIEYAPYTAFNDSAITSNTTSTQGSSGFWNFDLSGMSVDNFSAKYIGKTFIVQNSSGTYGYKFYDSSRAPKLEGLLEDGGSRNDGLPRTQVDINEIKKAVEGGSTLAEAVASKLGGTVEGNNVKFTGPYNGYQIRLTTETLRHYDVDFSNLNVKIPDALYVKGFRAYCASDNKEWFNFVFTDGTNTYDSDKDNIKSINIDVSGVKNVTELVKTIYKQGNAILTGGAPKFNHHMRLAADVDNKIITLYDHRRFDVTNPPYHYQEQGAKIADGISFTEEEPGEEERFVRDLVIQHTDKAGMNIHIQIPHMTLDKIFDPLPINPSTIFDYPVTTKESRNYLLGNPNPPGILDNELKYLLDAATLVGAQNRRLEFTAGNITTEIENLTASESVITDADMAKEMTEYTKTNVLSQAAQAMLAQANQNQSMALSLLE